MQGIVITNHRRYPADVVICICQEVCGVRESNVFHIACNCAILDIAENSANVGMAQVHHAAKRVDSKVGRCVILVYKILYRLNVIELLICLRGYAFTFACN